MPNDFAKVVCYTESASVLAAFLLLKVKSWAKRARPFREGINRRERGLPEPWLSLRCVPGLEERLSQTRCYRGSSGGIQRPGFRTTIKQRT